MGTRRKAREAALQFLFQDDFQRNPPAETERLEDRFTLFCELYQVNSKAKEYTLELVRQTISHTEKIDELIRLCAKNWRLERIAYTDRNLLRIAVCEMLYFEDVPHQVAINEAVEIAKRYGTAESPSFVNGILDAVQKHIHE
jgi:transcription antitermination protein NusB